MREVKSQRSGVARVPPGKRGGAQNNRLQAI